MNMVCTGPEERQSTENVKRPSDLINNSSAFKLILKYLAESKGMGMKWKQHLESSIGRILSVESGEEK
jgi:hypothetical protein